MHGCNTCCYQVIAIIALEWMDYGFGADRGQSRGNPLQLKAGFAVLRTADLGCWRDQGLRSLKRVFTLLGNNRTCCYASLESMNIRSRALLEANTEIASQQLDVVCEPRPRRSELFDFEKLDLLQPRVSVLRHLLLFSGLTCAPCFWNKLTGIGP